MAKPFYERTGKFYVETVAGLVDATEEPWELKSRTTPDNLCDNFHLGDCDNKGIYYTDDFWAMTFYCDKHFQASVADGSFKLIPEVWEVRANRRYMGRSQTDNEAVVRQNLNIPATSKLTFKKVSK